MFVFAAIWAWLIANPAILSLGVATIYEIILRKWPTAKDYSILNFIKRLADQKIENIKPNGNKHE